MILCERPSSRNQMGMFARKNGKYTRPIVGSLMDLRTEDFLPTDNIEHILSHRMVGGLPEIPEINQTGLFFVAEFNHVVTAQATEEEILPLLESGAYFLLQGSRLKGLKQNKSQNIYKRYEDSRILEMDNGKWWEYAAIFDADGQYIKAPKEPRAGEPTPEQIDELLDEYEENVGRLDVTSPYVLERRNANKVRPKLAQKLAIV